MWKVTQSAFPDQELRCHGEVIGEVEDNGARILECALQIVNPLGAQVASGSARVRFS